MPIRADRDKPWALLGILFFLLLNYPWLQIFNLDILVGGVPILALYLFGVWLLAIGWLYALSRRLSSQGQPGQKESQG